MVRSALVLALVAVLAGDVRAQAPAPPARATWWSEVRAWQQLAERWSSAKEPLVRAALVRLAWEATAEDPAARRACNYASAAGKRSAGGALFLTALGAAGPPPPIVPWVPGVAVEPEPVLTEATRLLALCARLDQEDGEACLAAWRVEGADAPDLAGLEGVPAARARLALLAGSLPALGRPGPGVPRVVPGIWWAGVEPVGWLAGATPRAWVVEDERGERRLLSRRDELLRVTLDDQAVAALVQRVERLARRARRGFVDLSLLEVGALAHDADAAGRRWLAHALLVAADAQPGMAPAGAWEARLVARWAQRRLLEAGRRWRERASDDEVRALVEPARSLGALASRLDAEALAAALVPVEREAPPTWADWEAAGLEERLERLGGALAWAELDDPFPPDAPPGPDGRRPTLRTWLDGLGWSGLPLRVEHVDDRRLLRATEQGPAGLLRVADVMRATPYGLGVARGGRLLEARGPAARAWWDDARELGAAGWWRVNLREVVERRAWDLRGLPRDLGRAATPMLLRALAEPTGGGARESLRRARCLTAGAELEDGDLAAAFLIARDQEEPRVALAGALGLARLEASLVPPDAPRPGLERLRSTARWLVTTEAPTALEALLALEPFDLALAGELTRALAARRYDDIGVGLARSCTPGETLDRRLALCRLVTLLDDEEVDLDELEQDPDALLSALAEWRARARRAPSPPGELPELVTPWALEVLAEDAPLWRDDPPRRDHAATTAVLLGPDVADALSARVGVDVRAVAAARLTQPDRGAAAAARVELARCTHLRAWLLGADDRRAALAVLDAPEPGARLWLGQAVVQAELPAALRTRAEALVGREVTAGALVELLRAWADDPSGPPALRLELRFAAWSPPTLELSVGTAHDFPRCAVEVRSGPRALLRQTLDGAPATRAEQPLRAALQALSERYRAGAHATLVATR